MAPKELLSKYFETRARFMHRLEKLEEYLSKYYWVLDYVIRRFLPQNLDTKMYVEND